MGIFAGSGNISAVPAAETGPNFVKLVNSERHLRYPAAGGRHELAEGIGEPTTPAEICRLRTVARPEAIVCFANNEIATHNFAAGLSYRACRRSDAVCPYRKALPASLAAGLPRLTGADCRQVIIGRLDHPMPMRFQQTRPAASGGCGRRAHILRCLLLAVFVAGIASVQARPQSQAAPGCELAPIGTGKVRRILDGRTIQLEIGQQVRLAAIEVPSLPLPRDVEPQARAALAAKAALESLVAGRTVTLKKHGPDADRYGRVVAHVFVEGKERSVQHHLLAEGHARVAAEVGSLACARELLAAESAARAARLGLWSDPHYAVQRAEDPTRLLTERGRFVVVEGKVLSVRESRGVIFINFGRRWSEDFTVTVLKRNESIFNSAGLALKQLSRREIRVRGVIEQRGGPWIEVTRPEQIELVE